VAKLVEIIGVTHNPFLPRLFREDPDCEPGIRAAFDNFGLMREKLKHAKPDVLIVVASDHLNQWFMDNMPPFIVGKALTTDGPFPHEVRHFKLSEYHAKINIHLAKVLIQEGFHKGVDFAFSDEFLIDHAFTMPLSLICPEMDLPIVPVFTNVSASPIPPAQRFYDVGQAIRAIIDEIPSNQRVGVISSGHMSLDVGGPSANRSVDPEFDHRMMAWIAEGNSAAVIKEATWDRMLQAGNVTSGFSNYVLLMGLARGVPASYVDLNPSRFASSPFMSWEPEDGGTT